MGLHHRKLIDDEIKAAFCAPFCLKENTAGSCPRLCLDICSDICLIPYEDLIPPPASASNLDDQPGKPQKFSPFWIATVTVFAAAFLVLCCYLIYSKYYLGRQSSRRRRQPQAEETQDDFLDEDSGSMVDHPIWYIRTVGLRQSIISSITVCKYKRGEGLVEGAECSVCLNEFEEDETVRLLPKCSHAFHIHCIDTWLRSHTNCPMCRAPIVKNTVLTPLPEPTAIHSTPGEETPGEISQSSRGSDSELDSEVCEARIGVEEEGELPVVNGEKTRENSNDELNDIQPMRRSVSMDSLSASRISVAVGNVVPAESHGNSDSQLVKVNESKTRIVPKRFEGNSNLLRSLASSSKGRSLTNGPVSMKRSFSWNGKFFLRNYGKSRGLVFRSF